MSKTLKNLAVTAVFAMTSTAALATGNHHPPQQQGNNNQASAEAEAYSHANANAAAAAINNNNNNVGVNVTTPVKVSNPVKVEVETGPTNVGVTTGPTNVTTGPTNVTTGPTNVTTGPTTVTQGPVSNGSSSISQGGNVGDIRNQFLSFVAATAPALAGSVDNCLALKGTSFAISGGGQGGMGSIGGGNQKAEFIEQCAAVEEAMKVFALANGDKQQQAFALNLLIKALPNYAAPAMKETVEQINEYIDQNGTQEPNSVMQIFGAKAFDKKEAPAVVQQAPAAQAPQYVPVIVNVDKPVDRKIYIKVNPDGTPWKKPEPKCDCVDDKKAPAAPAAVEQAAKPAAAPAKTPTR